MIYTVLEGIFAGIGLALMLILLIESSRAISEKKRRRKMGLTDYYDRPIEKEKEEN